MKIKLAGTRQFPYIFMCLLTACSGSDSSSTAPDSAPEPMPQETVYPLELVVTEIVPPPQADEAALPELAGAYDDLIPIDENYPLPDVPSRLVDTTNLRGGYFLRPHIPTARTTADGRIGVGVNRAEGYSFMLFAPEKLKTHWMHSSDGSFDLMSDRKVAVAVEDMTPEDPTLSPNMFAVCDTSHTTLANEVYGPDEPAGLRNPIVISDTEEAYEFYIFSGSFTQEKPIVMTDKIFSVKVRVVVENPKTENARITSVSRVGEPIVATLPYAPDALFEPTITGDGRLLVARIRGTLGAGGGTAATTPTPWIDQDGVTQEGYFDIIYAYNPPGSGYEPCDPRGWTNFKPISYAHYEDAVRERYGFAKYPMRDSEGNLIPAGKDAGIAYPWVDSRGTNIMFTAYHRFPFSNVDTYHQDEVSAMVRAAIGILEPEASKASTENPEDIPRDIAFPAPYLMLPPEHVQPASPECGYCQETIPLEHAGPTRGSGVFGLWTKGKMVLMDNQTNGTDLGFRAADRGHRYARLYHGKGGVVRIGNGRTNIGNQRKRFEFDAYWPYNDTMLESTENKLFQFDNFRPADPHDVVWVITSGHGSAEFAFDNYLDDSAVIVSSMAPSMTAVPDGKKGILYLVANFGDHLDQPMRVQNAATGDSPLIPAFGRPIGYAKKGTRIEPVALGGVRGKGLWLSEDAGLAYTVPEKGKSAAVSIDQNYLGLFLDPRISSAGLYRLITLPSGTISLRVDADGERLLELENSGSTWTNSVSLGKFMQNEQWTHLGLQVSGAHIDVYLNGFLHQRISKEPTNRALLLDTGDITLGSPDPAVAGIRGWYDNFFLTARKLVNPQEACVHALGSMVRISGTGEGLPSAHADIAARLNDPGGTQYACATDYEGEDFSFLLDIPEQQHVGGRLNNIKPLHFGQPRPDESNNAFCLICHTDNSVTDSLAVSALELGPLPVELDPRRQPLQPFPAMIGHIPENWLDTHMPPQSLSTEGEWLLVDEVVLPDP